MNYRSATESTEEQPPEQEAAGDTPPTALQVGETGGGDLLGDLLSLDLPNEPSYNAAPSVGKWVWLRMLC